MGYFVDNPSRGSFLNTISSNAPLTAEQFFNFPFNNFFPKFYELIPAKVIEADYISSTGKITVDKAVPHDDGPDVVEAFPINVYIKKFPKIGDYVLLFEYKTIADKNNKDNTNVFIETMSAVGNADSIYYYIDILNINPIAMKNELYPLEGDIIFQGRGSQSIRFTSSVGKGMNFEGNLYHRSTFGFNSRNSSSNDKRLLTKSWIYGDRNGMPLIIMSSGRDAHSYGNHIPGGNIEDINKDYSSIYITSDSIIPLKISQDNSIFLSSEFSKNSPSHKTFSGAQIILTSNKLVFKSRGNTCLYSDMNVWINSTNSIVLTSGQNIVLEPLNDNGLIYLGKAAVQNGEPTVKADTLIEILKRLINTLMNDFGQKDNMIAMKALTDVKGDLDKIKSSNTYIL